MCGYGKRKKERSGMVRRSGLGGGGGEIFHEVIVTIFGVVHIELRRPELGYKLVDVEGITDDGTESGSEHRVLFHLLDYVCAHEWVRVGMGRMEKGGGVMGAVGG